METYSARRTMCAAALAVLCAAGFGAADLYSQCAGDITDNFEDGVLNPAFIVSTTCGTVQETGGKLVLSKASGCTGEAAFTQNSSVQVLCGDFNLMIDFELPSFPVPTAGSRWGSIQVQRLNGQPAATVERYYRFAPGDCAPSTSNYKAFTTNPQNCAAAIVPTTDMSGRFRISRIAATLRIYYWSAGAWQLLRSESGTTENLRIRFYTATDMSTVAHSIELDNLIVSSRPLVAPDLDSDGDVDLDDYSPFEDCASGPGIPHNGTTLCQQADLDGDDDVDQTDFGVFQRCYSGANNPVDPDCA